MRCPPQPRQLAINLIALGPSPPPGVGELSSTADSAAAGVGTAGTTTPEMA